MLDSALSPALAFVAGVLTILSPCVLPLVPIVLGSASMQHRLGPWALCAGLIASFTAFGLTIAVIGGELARDPEVLRQSGAALMILAGILLISPRAQALLARVAAPLAGWAQARQAGLSRYGLAGQALIGVMLGMIWIPCVGPTLGAATVLASQGQSLFEAAVVMAAYAAGISAVLLTLGLAARKIMKRWNQRLMTSSGRGKIILGSVLIAVAVLVLTGADHMIEGYILLIMPDWLIDLTVMY
jgi:cytochrome c-type biogenesis protein